MISEAFSIDGAIRLASISLEAILHSDVQFVKTGPGKKYWVFAISNSGTCMVWEITFDSVYMFSTERNGLNLQWDMKVLSRGHHFLTKGNYQHYHVINSDFPCKETVVEHHFDDYVLVLLSTRKKESMEQRKSQVNSTKQVASANTRLLLQR
jgi:hypothetical protein